MASQRPEVAGIIARFCEQLQQMGIRVEKAILFGSRARGEGGEASDIDVLVVSSDFEGMNSRERLELLGIAAARLWEPIEAIGYTPGELERAEPATLLEEILRTGVGIA